MRLTVIVPIIVYEQEKSKMIIVGGNAIIFTQEWKWLEYVAGLKNEGYLVYLAFEYNKQLKKYYKAETDV